MDEKLKFIVFRVLPLFKVRIQQRRYLTGGKLLLEMLLEERKLSISK